MPNFVYNPNSSKTYISQWYGFLQVGEYTSDITSSIKSQSLAYKEEIKRAYEGISSSIDDAARQQSHAVADAAAMIAGRLDDGFDEVSRALWMLDESIDQIATMVDWRLSQLVDQQRVSNLLLENIARLLHVPDIQKERQYHIEQGFKHYQNAWLDEDLYLDALENLLEAEKREKTDFVVIHRIGMIYLYCTKSLDIEQAEHYFRRAAKYAMVETNTGAQTLMNVLAGNASLKAKKHGASVELPKVIASESLFQAAVACYIQGKYPDAIDLSTKSVSMAPFMLEARFIKVKSLVATGADSKAVRTIEKLIKKEPFYAIKTITSSDLITLKPVQELLKRLRDNAVHEASERLERCKSAMVQESVARPIIREIEESIARNTYLDALTALNNLTTKRTWDRPYCEASLETFVLRETQRLEKEEKERLKAERKYAEWQARQEIKEENLRLQMERLRLQEESQRKNEIQSLLDQAIAEEQRQSNKWSLLRDYTNAIRIYDQAAKLGSVIAMQKVKELQRRVRG